jgi:YfiH family protein
MVETTELYIEESFVSAELPKPPGGPRFALSLRRAGDMSLARMDLRRDLLQGLGIEPARALFLKQIHSQRVINADKQRTLFDGIWEGALPEADGLLTARRQTVLCVSVADCLPVLLFDPETEAFCLLHSGWKGTGIVENAILQMRSDFGTRARDLWAVLGPCIGACCYRVPPDRYRLFQSRFGPASVREEAGEHYIDLQAANVHLLQKRGVENVRVAKECTSCNTNLGSFRRDGRAFSHMLAVGGSF